MNSKGYPTLLSLVFILTGFAAMISQIIVIRELIVLFSGNELTLGIIVGIWLLWTSIGSGFLGMFAHKLKRPMQILYILLIIITY